MNVYTVTKPGGTKDFEFEAYTRLLESIGVDVANAARVLEPDTQRRWLFTWHRQEEAEGFVRELRLRTRDGSWYVHELPVADESFGPVAPLDIYEAHDVAQEFKYYLAPASRERIIRAFPHTRMYPVTISHEELQQIQRQHGEAWWDQLAILVTGLSTEKVRSLGGYRIILPSGKIGYEDTPQLSTLV